MTSRLSTDRIKFAEQIGEKSTCQELQNFIDATKVGERTLPLLVPPTTLLLVFLYQLKKPSKVPRSVVPPTSSQQDLSEKALKGFTGFALITSTVVDLKQSKELYSPIIDAIPGMLKWANYLREQRMQSEGAQQICKSFSVTFLSLCHVPELSKPLRSTKGIYKCAI
ncbi:hypothetical protein D9758_007825 [Tetrapyrgos nigripes]|uniref:Uncharacterized protein n=1 Tax=Tetrapyrgos nigripes TaxID=182062 RepID=A0A8H5CZX1_9AGAR|nr:hypothetical protein D9758_007825 [Tetrapyrgos nigripes]